MLSQPSVCRSITRGMQTDRMSEAVRPFVNHWNHADHAGYLPNGPRLHWYVLPPDHVWEVVDQVQTMVSGPTLGPIPMQWLHCTVIQLVPGNEVHAEDRAVLLDAGRESVRDLAPFSVDGFAVAGGQGATWMLEPVSEITELHHRIVEVSKPYLSAPRPQHYKPHITMSYSHGEGDASLAVEALREAPRLPFFTVDRVWLLNVTRQPGPEMGWYSWEVLGEAPLLG
jgi:2'-5' RNA ligase